MGTHIAGPPLNWRFVVFIEGASLVEVRYTYIIRQYIIMYTSLSVYKFWVLKRSGCSLFHKGGVSCRWSFCGGGLMLSSFERGLYCESGLLWLVVSCEGACSLVQVVFCGSLSQVCSTMKVYRPVSGLLWSVMRVVFPDGLMSTVLLYHTWSFLIVWCLRFSCIIHGLFWWSDV